MKRAFMIVFVAFLVAFQPTALSEADVNTPLDARLNQRMALRTGPNTAYTEIFTVPKDTAIVVYNREMGNGVEWAQVEFEYGGALYRGYTGMKRIDTEEDVPWMQFTGLETSLSASVTPRFGPGDAYAAHEDALPIRKPVLAFYSENGYTMIDFEDGLGGTIRAWVRSSALSVLPDAGVGDSDADEIVVQYLMYDAGPASANQNLALRTGPNRAYTLTGGIAKTSEIAVIYQTTANGAPWGYVEYGSEGEWYRGYTGMQRIDAEGDVPLVQEYSETAHTLVQTVLLYGPGSDYAALPGKVPAGAAVEVYFASLDESWVMVDCDDNGALRRGWMKTADLSENCVFIADTYDPNGGY